MVQIENSRKDLATRVAKILSVAQSWKQEMSLKKKKNSRSILEQRDALGVAGKDQVFSYTTQRYVSPPFLYGSVGFTVPYLKMHRIQRNSK